MARRSTGTVVVKQTRRGRSFALRFRAHGKRQFLHLGYDTAGWTYQRAHDELTLVMAQVRAGVWEPPPAEPEPEAVTEPLFTDYARTWLERRRAEIRPATADEYEWEIGHLSRFFHSHTLRDITVADVDSYRHALLKERERCQAAIAADDPLVDDNGRVQRGLSPTSINKTITRLGQILDQADEHGLIDRNPVRVNPRNRKLKVSRNRRPYLDDAAQIAALLEAAGKLDAEAREDRQHIERRSMLTLLVFTGLRIGELLALRWRHIELAAGRLRVVQSKTDAGERHVTLLPAAREELIALKLRATDTSPDAYVFATSEGKKLNASNLRVRVLEKAIERANERLDTPLPDGVTFHSMRHTFISLLFATGHELPVVMAEAGHADASVTVGIYAHVMRRDADARKRLRALVDRADWAPAGTSTAARERTSSELVA